LPPGYQRVDGEALLIDVVAQQIPGEAETTALDVN
jgi:hypothetical protein